ncbi:hypothetical protein GCM10022409_31140 [Hymenobacter glaciei]|uniref:Lipoprotein n=1 Tax=Hymenobacter glaciei TaxID=877209 RepID=A0ABP7UGK1_9BACT
MKTCFYLVLAVTLLAGCKKDDPAAGLPAATHTGANTAGCLINGQPFVATGFGSGPGRVAGLGGGFAYDSAYYLRLNGKLGGQDGSLHIFLNSVPDYKNQALLGEYLLNNSTSYLPIALPGQCLSYAAFFPNDNTQEVYRTDAQHTGKVEITYVDISNVRVKRVSSGTFESTAVSNLNPNKTLRVTSGRFDRQQ